MSKEGGWLNDGITRNQVTLPITSKLFNNLNQQWGQPLANGTKLQFPSKIIKNRGEPIRCCWQLLVASSAWLQGPLSFFLPLTLCCLPILLSPVFICEAFLYASSQYPKWTSEIWKVLNTKTSCITHLEARLYLIWMYFMAKIFPKLMWGYLPFLVRPFLLYIYVFCCRNIDVLA
jgi:hypothetical protein